MNRMHAYIAYRLIKNAHENCMKLFAMMILRIYVHKMPNFKPKM